MARKEPPQVILIIDEDRKSGKALENICLDAGLEYERYVSGEEFLRNRESFPPGCIVMDVHLPGMNGMRVFEYLLQRDINTPVIMTSAMSDVSTAVQAMKRGVVDFIEKPIRKQRLRESIKDALRIDKMQRAAQRRYSDCKNRLETLTTREMQVLDLMVASKPTKHIARDLRISPKTVETHRTRVLDKMGVISVTELVRMVLLAQSYQRPALTRASRMDLGDRAIGVRTRQPASIWSQTASNSI